MKHSQHITFCCTRATKKVFMETNTVAIAITISVTTFFRILFELIFYQNRVILLPQPAGQRLRRLPVFHRTRPVLPPHACNGVCFTRAAGCFSRVRKEPFHACGGRRFTRAFQYGLWSVLRQPLIQGRWRQDISFSQWTAWCDPLIFQAWIIFFRRRYRRWRGSFIFFW